MGEMAFMEKRFPLQENLRCAVLRRPRLPPPMGYGNGLGLGKGHLSLLTGPGVGCVLPSLVFGLDSKQ